MKEQNPKVSITNSVEKEAARASMTKIQTKRNYPNMLRNILIEFLMKKILGKQDQKIIWMLKGTNVLI